MNTDKADFVSPVQSGASTAATPGAIRRFDDDWAPNPNDDHGEDRPNDPHDDLTPGADSTDRAGVPATVTYTGNDENKPSPRPDINDVMALIYLYGSHVSENPEDAPGAIERLGAIKAALAAAGVRGTSHQAPPPADAADVASVATQPDELLRASHGRLKTALERIALAKPDGLDHSIDVSIIERAAKIARAALGSAP